MKGHYEIRKSAATGKWHVAHIGPGWLTPLGSYAQRKQALMTARLLAGRRGKVVVA